MNLHMTQEQFEAIQARIKESARKVRGKASAFDQVKVAKPKERVKRRVFDPKLSESQVLAGCIAVLDAHPMVSLWWRQNTGMMKRGERFIKFSFKGASDLMAVITRSGRFCAIECKKTGGKATPDQQAFLDNVRDSGGLSVCVDDPAKLKAFVDAQA